MKTPLLLLASLPAMLALSLASCDSKRENARENNLERKADSLEEKAAVVRDEKEKVADAVESRDPGLNAPATTEAAKTIRETGERQADALENKADQEREKK